MDQQENVQQPTEQGIESNQQTLIVAKSPKASVRVLVGLAFLFLVVLFLLLVAMISFYFEREGLGEHASNIHSNETVDFPVRDDFVFSTIEDVAGLSWTPKLEAFKKDVKNPPQLCALQREYCGRVGYSYADFACDCFVYQYFDDFKTYRNDDAMFSVYYPTMWHDVDEYSHPFMKQIDFVVEREKTSCVMSYGNFDEDVASSYGTYSTSTILLNEGEMQTIDILFDGDVSDEQAASGYTPNQVVIIPHFPHGYSSGALMVESGDSQPLLEACVGELRSTALSVVATYDPIVLNEQSKGRLYLSDKGLWYGAKERVSSVVRLLFEDVSGVVYEVAHGVFDGVGYVEDVIIKGNELYFTVQDEVLGNVLYVVNLFSGEKRRIDISQSLDQLVHSFYVDGDWVYFLRGDNCNQYMRGCSLSLFRYHKNTHVEELIVKDTTARDILGFGDDGRLYVAWREGDAGCTWGKFESIDVLSKKIRDEGSYQYCIDMNNEPDDSVSAKHMQDILSRISSAAMYDFIYVEDGVLSTPVPYQWQDGGVVPMGELIHVVK